MRESRFERFRLLATFLFRQIQPNVNDRDGLPHRKLPKPLYWLVRPIRLIGNLWSGDDFTIRPRIHRPVKRKPRRWLPAE